MGKIEQVTVGLPLEMADDIKRAVASGEYASVGDAIIAALRDWKDSRDHFGRSDRELGDLWDVGIASGRGKLQSADEIIAEAKRRATFKS